MASKNDKTSKTARVMSLLSKKPDPASSEETAEAGVPPIVSSMVPDAAVSAQIKNALEDTLEDELGPAPQPQPAPVQQAAPAPQPEPAPAPVQQAAPAPQPEPAPAPIQQAAPAPQPEPAPAPVQQAAPAPQPEPAPAPVQQAAPAPQPEPEEPPEVRFMEPLHPLNPGYVNVMQVLVEEKAPKYAKIFGLCTCARCMEDVKAYTLNHLPSKYVVMEPGDRIPRLTVYEGRFASDITAQMLQACKVIMAHPHHGR